jgi:integration host factor subunit beta
LSRFPAGRDAEQVGDDGTMTKSDLIDVLCETQKIPKGRAELLVQVIFESMEEALKRGERIEIRGFGSFELRSYKPYEGRNPRTGVRVNVQPKRLPFFKVGKELKERVNAGRNAAPSNGPASGWTDAKARLARPEGKPAGDGVPAIAPESSTGPVPAAPAAAASAEPPAAPGATRVSA